MKDIVKRTRALEEKLALLFSARRPFSEHLVKWEDGFLPDKYDHNCFFYSAQPDLREYEKALAYQLEKGAGFIKLEGDRPLDDPFGLEEGVTLTMALAEEAPDWKTNADLSYGRPELPELEAIERKHFGPVYGEDFTIRNVRRLYAKLDYHGAYLGSTLAGSCYSFSADGITCLDGLIVDLSSRHRGVASSLIRHIKKAHPEDILILHADAEDTPKDMYQKMGFETVDRLYEYIRTDLSC